MMEKPEYEATRELEDSHWWFVGMRRIVDNMLAPYLPAAPWQRLLDAGCGTGGNFAWLGRHASQTIGLDISSIAIGFSRNRGLADLVMGSASESPFADDSFDTVTAFDLLGQLPPGHDERALSEFYRLLVPGGLLIVRVPAYQWLRSRHDEVVHAFQRYSSRQLSRKLRLAGFRLLRITYATTLLFPVAVVRRLLGKIGATGARSDLVGLPGPLNRACLMTLEAEAGLVSKRSLPFGLTLLALARKPLAETIAA